MKTILLACIVSAAWVVPMWGKDAVDGVVSASGKPYVMMVLAHPDDFEGCSGLAFRMKDDYRVQVVDFTRGEGGCGPEGFADGTTAIKRVAEERAVTAPLGVEPIFLSQTNYQGRLAFADARATAEIEVLLLKLRPRAVFTHWPCDSHPDHVQCFAATMHALDLARRDHGFKTELVFLEETVSQTTNFHPTHYVDITPAMPLVAAQLPKYACQNGPRILENKKTRNAAHGARLARPVAFAEPYEVYGFNPKFGDGSVLDRYTVSTRPPVSPSSRQRRVQSGRNQTRWRDVD